MTTTLEVLYDYAAQGEDECTLKKGDRIVGFREQEGWWQGNSQGKDGVFPGNYVKVVAAVPPPMPAPNEKSSPLAQSNPLASGTRGPANPVTAKTEQRMPARTRSAPETKNKKKDVPFQFMLVAHNMGYGASFMNASLGLCAIAWASGPDREVLRSSSFIGFYALLLAFPMYFWESLYGLARKPDSWEISYRFPVRSIAYFLLALPMLATNPTLLAALYMFALSFMQFMAWYYGEAVNPRAARKRPRPKKDKGDTEVHERLSLCQRIDEMLHSAREAGRIPKYTWITVYFVLNFMLGVDAFNRWVIITKGSNGKLSGWTPWAKTFGQLLNFNCALILCPVARNLLKRLNNYSVSSLTSMFKYIPLQKNIVSHKLIAFVIFVSAYLHTMAHFFNFASSSDSVMAAFGLQPWLTGYAITLAMFFIYAAAADRVRMANYNLFFTSHHWFIVFFVMLIFHGPKFKFWCCIPITLYVTERIMRVKRGNHSVYVREVKWIDPVLAVYFCPRIKEEFKFKEGQYLYLCCPTINKNEWHPFTISSCYDDLMQNDFVSCHIKVHKGGWTEKLKNLFNDMNPHGDYPFVLSHINEKGEEQVGKYKGPNGKELLKVDGPHSAPSEHYDKYETVMVVGAGIGLTPCASILRAVTQYKWKRGFYPELLHLYWVVRQSELPGFQWFVRYLTEVERDLQMDRMNNLEHMRNTYVEINVYVTRASKDFETPQVLEKFDTGAGSRPKFGGLKGAGSKQSNNKGGGAMFSAQALMELLCHPPVKSSAQARTMGTNPNAPNRMQDVWAWDGRPDWEQIFAQAKANRRYRDIAVCFCGTPIVGRDLKRMCKKYSSVDRQTDENEVLFHLHKENF